MYRIPELTYFSLLLVQSSQNMRVVLMVSTFHSDALQGCRDAPSPWPCVKSSRALFFVYLLKLEKLQYGI